MYKLYFHSDEPMVKSDEEKSSHLNSVSVTNAEYHIYSCKISHSGRGVIVSVFPLHCIYQFF